MFRILRRKYFHSSKTNNRIQLHDFYSTKSPSKKVEIEINGAEKLVLSSGQLARLADGSAVARIGNTAVMTTVVSKGKPSTQDFLPLTVDYRQKAAAAGRIPTNFLRREMGASDREILVGRMVDRSLRPLFKKGYNTETGINCNLLSVDGVHNPEVASINAASAALMLSDVPWGPAVGAVQLGYVDNKIVVNPTRKQLARSHLNLIVAGTSTGLATMLEGDARCLDHQTFLYAIKLGLEECAKIAISIETMGKEMGKPKRQFGVTNVQASSVKGTENLSMLVDTLCSAKLRAIYTDYSLDKQNRDRQMFLVRDEMISKIRSLHAEVDSSYLNDLFFNLSKNIVRNLIFQENLRVDGRSITDIRPISCEVNLHDPLHGSALFQRGQTQVLCTVALDSLQSVLKLDPITALTGGVKEKNFMLHYEFPGYATGELGKGGSRRELGHGALAERALRQVLPAESQFTTRLTSEVLESNGSSSMASICGGTLALLDAGVSLTEMASGVAMGLVTNSSNNTKTEDIWNAENYRVLTDINGMEDFLGDMDFKFSNTRTGVCALQADVKLPGISIKVIEEAIEGGVEANHKILDIMSQSIDKPRVYKDCWPVTSKLEVPAHKRGKFMGQAGLNIRKITQDTGVQLYPESEGVWQLFAPNPESMGEAESIIQELLTEEKVPELEFGAIYTGRITEILENGIMLQLHDRIPPVLLHNTHLTAKKIRHPSVLGLEVGQDLQVKYYGRDPSSGQMRLSRKALTVSSAAAVKNLQNAMKRKDDGDSPPPPSGGPGTGGGQVESAEPPTTRQKTRKLVINENKNPYFIEQADYKKLMENSIQRAAAIDTSILFVRKQHNEHETNVNNIESAFSNSNNINDNTSDEINDETKAVHLSDLYTISSDNNVSNINEEVKSDISYFKEEENAKNVPSYQKIHEIAKDDHDTDIDFQNVVLINDEKDTFKDVVVDKQTQQDQVVEISEIDEESVYYEIDKLFNQLMSVNLEITEATERKHLVDKEWDFVKKNIQDLEHTASKEILHQFHSDKVQLCKKFSTQSKAINETLILLTRQYRDIKADLEKAKETFMKAKNPALSREQIKKLRNASEKEDIVNSNHNEDIYNLEDVDTTSNTVDPKALNKQVLSELVQSTVIKPGLRKPVLPPKESADFMAPNTGLDSHEQWNSYQIPERWNNAFPVLDKDKDKFLLQKRFTASEPEADQEDEVVEKNVVNDLEAYRAKKNYSRSLWNDMSRLKSSLTSIPIEVPPIIQQNMDPGLNMERAASLMGRKFHFNLYNIESDLHKFIQSRKADVTSKKDTDTEAKILEMLENNKKDFTTLKTWYQQARNNNQTKSKDYLNGIFFLHKNVQRNVQELDNNYQFLINQRSGVAFVGRHLSKSNHPLVDLAQKHITRLESIYQENLRVLSTDRPIYSDVNISANALWEEYHRVRIQLKQIRKRLWEVELSEERIADLDDWRQDDGQTKAADAAHKELLVAIDSVQSKIDGFTKADMERNWSAVERDLRTLQGLKVQGIINWLKSSSYLPEWMHEDLRDHVLSQCYRYLELEEKRKHMQNYWWKLSAKDDSIDLSLDVLYSQIRSCIAKVKYSTMENERHRKELNIYSSWVERFGPRLREQSRCRLQDLIKKGETKVEEIEQAVQIYVEVMHSGQEYERNAAQLLDRMRADKRTIVGKIQPSIFMACRQVRYEGVEMLRYDEDLIVDDE